jgi:hypothetical protein
MRAFPPQQDSARIALVKRKARLYFVVVAVALCARLAARAADEQKQPQTQTLAEGRAEERKGTERQWADYPALGTKSLSDLIHFRLNRNDLEIYSRLAATSGMSRVSVPELPSGMTAIDVRSGSGQKAGEAYVPIVLLFQHYDFDKPGTRIASTTVQVTPMNLQVAQDLEGPTGLRQVLLMVSLSNINNDSSESPVRMTVTTQGNFSMSDDEKLSTTAPADAAAAASTEAPPMKIEHKAADFVSLRRQFPGDVANYLEPIFRELHADGAVFGPDRKLAWEVFVDQATPDPKAAERVKQIVTRMDSDDVHERDAAAAELAAMGESAAVSLLHMDRSIWSPEQQSRIDSFLSPFKPVSDDDVKRLRDDPNFLLDCLYDTDDFVVGCALERLRQITGKAVAFDPSLRDGARRDAVNKLRAAIAPPTTNPASS